MNTNDTPFQVGPGGSRASSDSIESPQPPPLLNLTDEERQVFDYICSALRASGVEHLTAGMPIAMIVRKYRMWIDALAKCEADGRHQVSPNGWAQHTPWSLDESRLANELAQWLPKACLTIPALTRVKKDAGVTGAQDDLFAALVEHGTASPGKSSPH